MVNVIVISSLTGVKQNVIPDFWTVYPNPNNGNFAISYHQESINSSFQIIDLSGRIVHQEIITGEAGRQIINVPGLDNGIYFWKILSEGNVSAKGKITILK
jgi:hypothetical protein